MSETTNYLSIAGRVKPQTLQFSYGSATFSAYRTGHSHDGWLNRKIHAIPNALHASILTITDIATAAFRHLPHSLKVKDATLLKVSACLIERDLLSIVGHLLTLVYDTGGSYLVDASTHHRTWYNEFKESSENLWDLVVRGGPTAENYQHLPQGVLSRVTRNDLGTDARIEPTLALSDEELFKLPVSGFKEQTYSRSIVQLRLHLTPPPARTVTMSDDIGTLTTSELVQIPSDKLGTIIKQIPKYCLVFITKKQLHEMDYTDVDYQIMGALFPRDMDLTTQVDRFSAIPPETLKTLIWRKDVPLTTELMSYISIEQMRAANVQFSGQDLSTWFDDIQVRRGVEVAKQLFALVPQATVQAAYATLTPTTRYLCSETQNHALDLTQLHVERLLDLAKFTDDQVASIVHRLNIAPIDRLTSIGNQIDWSQFKREALVEGFVYRKECCTTFFANLSKEKLEQLMPLLGVEFLVYAQDRIGEVNLALLDKEKFVASVIAWGTISHHHTYNIRTPDNYNNHRELFYKLPKKTREELIDLSNPEHLFLLKDEDFATATISDETLQKYFGRSSREPKKQERFDLLSPVKISGNLDYWSKCHSLLWNYPTEKLQALKFTKEQLFNAFPFIENNFDNRDQTTKIANRKAAFNRLLPAQIQPHLEALPQYLFYDMSDRQLAGLELSELSLERLKEWFCPEDFYLGSASKQMLQKLSKGQLQPLLQKLDIKLLKQVSQEQALELDLSGIKTTLFQEWFVVYGGPKDYLSKFSSANLQKFVTKLKPEWMDKITDDQLKQLDLGDLSQEQLFALFPLYTRDEAYHIVSYRNYIDNNKNHALVDAKMKERQELTKARLALLSEPQVAQIREKLGEERQALLTAKVS